jgi:hypothetical protein
MPCVALHELALDKRLEDATADPPLWQYVEGHDFDAPKTLNKGESYFSNLSNTSPFGNIKFVARAVAIYGKRAIVQYSNKTGGLQDKTRVFLSLDGPKASENLKAVHLLEQKILQKAGAQKVFTLGKVSKGKDGEYKCALDKARFKSNIIPNKSIGSGADVKEVWGDNLFCPFFMFEKTEMPADLDAYRKGCLKARRTCLLHKPSAGLDRKEKLRFEDVGAYELFKCEMEPYLISNADKGGFSLNFRLVKMERIPEDPPKPQPIFGDAPAPMDDDEPYESESDGEEIDADAYAYKAPKPKRAREGEKKPRAKKAKKDEPAETEEVSEEVSDEVVAPEPEEDEEDS